MRQIYPVQGPDLPLIAQARADSLPDSVAELAVLYGNEAAPDVSGPPVRGPVRANMVASTDGAVALGGRSGGLSGAADRMVFTVLRSLADVVLVGSGTARTERYQPVRAKEIWPQLRPQDAAPLPPIAVVSGTLNLAGCERLLTMPPGGPQTIVITTAAPPADRLAMLAGRARIIQAGTDRVDIGTALQELAELGYRHVLCEGGPTLLGELVSAGLLDELCLTTSPVLAAGSAGRIVASRQASPAGAAARLSLVHVLCDGDFLLCRYRAA